MTMLHCDIIYLLLNRNLIFDLVVTAKQTYVLSDPTFCFCFIFCNKCCFGIKLAIIVCFSLVLSIRWIPILSSHFIIRDLSVSFESFIIESFVSPERVLCDLPLIYFE